MNKWTALRCKFLLGFVNFFLIYISLLFFRMKPADDLLRCVALLWNSHTWELPECKPFTLDTTMFSSRTTFSSHWITTTLCSKSYCNPLPTYESPPKNFSTKLKNKKNCTKLKTNKTFLKKTPSEGRHKTVERPWRKERVKWKKWEKDRLLLRLPCKGPKVGHTRMRPYFTVRSIIQGCKVFGVNGHCFRC